MPESRWGWGKPAHPALVEAIASRTEIYEREIGGFQALVPFFRGIARDEAALRGVANARIRPVWKNQWFPPVDAVALTSTVASRKARRYVEVGSGHSTRFVRACVDFLGLPTTITSIDPAPRAEIDALCTRVVRSPLEKADLSVFDELEANDVVFIDNSHYAFTGSDATVSLLEVVPRLAPGVVIGFHDIFLPDDYPPRWSRRWFNEQYVLAAFLLARGTLLTPTMPTHYCATTEPHKSRIADLFRAFGGSDLHQDGAAFFCTVGGR